MNRPPRAAALIAIATLLGLTVRALPVLGAGFPLSLGGMFHATITDLQSAGLQAPIELSYNDAHIPFVYPPLGFYVAAIISQLGIPVTDLMQWLPVVYASLAIPAFYLAARAILGGEARPIVATFAYALFPPGWEPLVQGAGIARGLGITLALLAVFAAARLAAAPSRRGVVFVSVLAGLACLAHPGVAVFAVLSVVLVIAGRMRERPAIDRLGYAGLSLLGAAAVASPWLIFIVTRHGLGPVGGALAGQGGWQAFVFNALVMHWVEAPIGNLTVALGLVGLVAAVARRRFFLPIWLVLSFVGNGRGVAMYSAIPFAMLIAIGIIDVILLPLVAITGQPEARLLQRPATRAFIGAVLGLAITSNLLAPLAGDSPLGHVSVGERAAMAWARTELPRTSLFAIVTGGSWADDYVSEWFPTLAGSRSVATAQGYEWFGQGAFGRQQLRHTVLQQCARTSANCVQDWIASVAHDGERITHVFVVKNGFGDCCRPLVELLSDSKAFTRVFDGPDAAIFAVGSG